MMKKFLLAILIVLLPCLAVAADRYAVPTGGASSGSCTIGSPCTLAYAISGMSGGDDIYLRGGTYDATGGIALSGSKNGTASGTGCSNYSSIQSYTGEWAVLDGNNATGSAVEGFVIGKYDPSPVLSCWEIAHLEIKNGRYSETSNRAGGILYDKSNRGWFHHLYIHDNYVYPSHSSPGSNNPGGIRLRQSQYVLIEYNYLDENGYTGNNLNAANIVMESDYVDDPTAVNINVAMHTTEIRYNLSLNSSQGFKDKNQQFLSLDHTGTHMTYKEYGNKIHHNIIKYPANQPVMLESDFNQVYNNIFDQTNQSDNAEKFSCLHGPDQHTDGERIYFHNCFYNNTILKGRVLTAHSFNGSDSLSKNSSWEPTPSDPINPYHYFYNNIFYNDGTPDNNRYTMNIVFSYSDFDLENDVIDIDTIFIENNLFTPRSSSEDIIRIGSVTNLSGRDNLYTAAEYESAGYSANMYTQSSSSGLFTSGYLTNGSFLVDGSTTITNGGTGGSHPYLSGVTIPLYVGAVDPSDQSWVDTVQGLSTITNLYPGEAPPQTITVSVAATDATADEENVTDTGTFTITASEAVSGNMSVNYSMSGTATNGIDYSSLSGSATILDGQTSTTVTVTPVADDDYEGGSETAIMTITSGSGYNVGSPSNSTVTITDTDPYSGFGPGKIYGANSAADYPGTVEDSWMNKYYTTNEEDTNVQLWNYTYGSVPDTNYSANNIIISVDLSDYDSLDANSATIWLHNQECTDCGDATYQISVHQISGVTPVISDLNWDYYNITGVGAWTGATNDVQGGYSDIGAALDTVNVGISEQWYSWDISSAADACIGTTCYFLIISDYGITPASNDTQRRYDSSEAADATLRPVVVVDYNTEQDPVEFIDGIVYGDNTLSDIAGGLSDTWSNRNDGTIQQSATDLRLYAFPVGEDANIIYFQPVISLYNPTPHWVEQAKLYMYFDTCDGVEGCGDASVTATIHQVTTGTKPNFTYLNWTNYDDATAWTNSGATGGGLSDIGAAFDSTVITDTAGQWIEFVVGPQFEDCLDGTDSICTWLVQLTTDGSTSPTADTNRYFVSAEGNADYAPMLISDFKESVSINRATVFNGVLYP